MVVGPFISKITLLDGTSFDFEENDVIIFVGANNCGKSTILKGMNDLYSSSNKNISNVLISSITITNSLENNTFKDLIIGKSVRIRKYNSFYYKGVGYEVSEGVLDNIERMKSNSEYYSNIFSSFLSTKERLTLVEKKKRKEDGSDAPSEVYHIYEDSSEKFSTLKSLFEKVFGTKLFFYPAFHSQNLDFKISQEELRECSYTQTQHYTNYKKLYNDSPSIEDQGDGMKSFTGIVSELIAGDKNTYFIDEPESFLHPPQAYVLGQEIIELSEGQLFLATHSQDFLRGILSKHSTRVKIFRIIRSENGTLVHKIENGDLLSIQSDPFLHYSNYLNSLFNHYTIVCEDSTDCIFYNKVIDIILKEQNKQDISINYVYAGGKHAYTKIYNLSKKLKVNSFFIGDMDILNEFGLLKSILGKRESKRIKANRDSLKQHINTIDPIEKKWLDIKQDIDGEINDEQMVSKNDIKKIISFFDQLKKPWDNLKEKGVSLFDTPPAYFINLLLFLEERRLFLVPNGEMENLIPSIEQKKGKFVNEALKLSDDSTELHDVKTFLCKIVDNFN